MANTSEPSPPATATTTPTPEAPTAVAPPLPAISTPQNDEVTAPPQPAPATVDPKVAQLAALFPATSNDIIEAVLAAVGGSLEQATETLLSMNDPAFAEPRQSQFDSDAEFARNLAAQDDPRQLPSSMPSGNLPYRPYVPRRRGVPSMGSMGSNGGEGQPGPEQGEAQRPRDELDQLTEGFAKLADKGSKLAEQGARTFGSFFSKVKDQINSSLDGGSGPQASTSSNPPFTAAPVSQPSATQPWSAPSPLPRPEPQARSSGSSIVPELLPRPKPASPLVASIPTPTTTSTASPPIAASSSKEAEEPKKDFSKIGLLPRQSVSLLDSKNKKDQDSDDEDLEYVRSPFDDD